MTKEEVRTLTISKLALKDEDILLDIGAGTGSISIEASQYCQKTYALERLDEAVDLINQNKEKFACDSLKVIQGLAPECLPKDQVNKVVIGGSGGRMAEIFSAIDNYPLERIVINTITLENTAKAVELLKKYAFDYEVVTITIAKSKKIGEVTMMMGQNPINIIRGVKNEK